MSKILLIGSSGSGKTHCILDEFEAALRTAPDPLAANAFLILPSAEHTDRVISLLLQRGVGGFFEERVTTLPRFIQKTFGFFQEGFISSGTRFFFLRQLLENNVWDYFKDVQKSPGFLNLVSQFLDELKDAMISAPEFRARMNRLKGMEPDLAPKYEALAGLYEAYEARLFTEKMRDRKDMLKLLREKKEKGSLTPRTYQKIWLDGFFDFSNLQLEYLGELARVSEAMTITLTKDPTNTRPELFEVVSRTERKLLELGFKPQVIAGKYQRSDKEALGFLERHLFSETKPARRASPNGAVTILEAVGVQGEVEMIAREIHRLSQAEDFRFSDVAILLREIGSYEPVIRSIFAREDIPVEIHERERLKLSPMVHALVLLLKIFREGWRRADLVNFLKSSYVVRLGETEKNYEWVNELENRSLQEGILRERENWLIDWPDHESAGEFNGIKKLYLGVLAGLEDALKGASDQQKNSPPVIPAKAGIPGLSGSRVSLRSPGMTQFSYSGVVSKLTRPVPEIKHLIFEALRKTFGIFQVRDSLEPWVRREAASFRRIESLFEEVETHLHLSGRTEISFEEFADHFLRLVELDLYSIHERDKNRVQVYDVSLARQKEYRVVFVSGLLEKGFPVRMKEDPLLSDWERRLANTFGREELQERLPRQNLERYLFYLAVTRATEQVFLTFPRMDQEGKESLASFYVEEVKAVFKDPIPFKKQDLARPFPELGDAMNRRELEIAAMGELWSGLEGKGFEQDSVTIQGSSPICHSGQDSRRLPDPESRPPNPGSWVVPASAFGRAGSPGMTPLADTRIGSKGGAEGLPLLLYVTNGLLADAAGANRIQKAFFQVKAEMKDPQIRRADYFRVEKTSATRLEEFAKCPYRHFANRVLRLKDPQEEVNLRRKGSIMHLVLENFFREWYAHPKENWRGAKGAALILKEFEAAAKKYPLIHEKKYRRELDHIEMKEMLLRFIEVELERLETAALRPSYFEFSFGGRPTDQSPKPDGRHPERSEGSKVEILRSQNPLPQDDVERAKQIQAPPLEFEVNSRKVQITGKIDRIDVDPTGRYGVVLDYKRSAQFKKADLEFGTALQLPIYLTVIEKFLKLTSVGGELYSLKECKKKGFYHAEHSAALLDLPAQTQKFTDAEYRAVIDRSWDYIRFFSARIMDLDISVRPRNCDSFCPFATVCRIEKWKLPVIEQEILEEDETRRHGTD